VTIRGAIRALEPRLGWEQRRAARWAFDPDAARNAGLDAATGTHIRFVDCDDVVAEAGTAHLLALAGDGDGVIAYGATQLCNEQLEPQRLLVCDVQGDAADWEWTLRALEHAFVRGGDRPVYLYRRHGDSIQSRALQEKCEAVHHAIVAAYFMRHREQAGGAFERHVRATPHLKYARTYLREGRLKRALSRLARGVWLDPKGGARTVGALAARQARIAAGRRRGRSA
jgi:glycosyltransferase involved in cell wall biosynthesis